MFAVGAAEILKRAEARARGDLFDRQRRLPQQPAGRLDSQAKQVREHAQEVLEAAAGIHHIYGISNSVMPETPIENFIAMHEAHAAFTPPQAVAV